MHREHVFLWFAYLDKSYLCLKCIKVYNTISDCTADHHNKNHPYVRVFLVQMVYQEVMEKMDLRFFLYFYSASFVLLDVR